MCWATTVYPLALSNSTVIRDIHDGHEARHHHQPRERYFRLANSRGYLQHESKYSTRLPKEKKTPPEKQVLELARAETFAAGAP
jgi:hypothetical protein